MILQMISGKEKSFTTLLTVLVFIEHYIETRTKRALYGGLSIPEVTRRYNIHLERTSGSKQFYGSYVQRHANATGFFYQENNRYFLRNELVGNLTPEELSVIMNRLDNLVIQAIASHEGLLEEINEVAFEDNPENLFGFIASLIENKRLKNYGQQFEVISYSILKVYFESLGFALKRFSTSFANDGGMDFISALGIYQVTTTPAKNKINSDIRKLPGISRVLVVPELQDKLLDSLVDNNIITNIVTISDLKDHFLSWLLMKEKYKKGLVRQVIETVRNELMREFISGNHESVTE